jgi:hypothetical protein
MKKLIIILSLFLSYTSYAQYVPKAGNKLNVKPNGILVPISTSDDTPISRSEIFDTGLSVLKASTLPTASASVLGVVRVGTGLAIDVSGILSATGGGGSYTAGYGMSLASSVFSVDTTGTSSIVSKPRLNTLNASVVHLAGTETITGLKTFSNILQVFKGNLVAEFGAASTNVDNYIKFRGSQKSYDMVVWNADDRWSISDNGSDRITVSSGGNVGIGGVTGPTARLHLPAGTATAGTAPLKFTSGTNLTTAVAGTMEYDGTSLFWSPSTTRKKLTVMNNVTPTTAQTLVGNGTDFTVTTATGTGTPVFSASPTFTGTPLSTTAAATVLTTQIATTAFAGSRLVLTANGTGAATTIVVPHGLTGITSTSYATAFPRNAASTGISYVTVDATNLNIVYTVAPASGTGNLSYSVEIKP